MHTLESLAAAADLSRVPTDELRTLSLAALREMGDFSISQQAFTTRSLFSDRAERELMARGVSFYTIQSI